MDDYPILRMIVRHGAAGVVAATAIVLVLVAGIGHALIGWLALPVAVLAALATYVLGRSYVELVRLITEMLLPR